MTKRFLFALILTVAGVSAFAQEASKSLFFHMKDGNVNVAGMGEFKELTFKNGSVYLNDTLCLALSEIDSLRYDDLPGKLKITWNGSKATWINPFWVKGIRVVTSGADVTVNNPNTTDEITTKLRGVTTDGSFTYNGDFKTTIELDSLTLTNTRGAAIDIECGKRVALEIAKGSINTLVDGTNGSQKAALYCKGHLEIDKSGTLNVTGNTAHAISAKEYIQLKKSDGIINILGAKKDGIHCKQYYLAKGFTVNISGVSDDCIQSELDGEENEDGYTDGSINIKAGTYSLTTSGNGCKCISADGSVNISDGTFTLTQTGSYLYDGTDISYPTAIKSDSTINITGGQFTINNTANGGKGLSAETNVNISGDATVLDITANGAGGSAVQNAEASTDPVTPEVVKSYKVYVALPTSSSSGGGPGGGGPGMSSTWTTVYLYKSDGTLVQQLISSVSKTSGTTTKTFYYYDFKASDSNTYYFKSADYTSGGGWGRWHNLYHQVKYLHRSYLWRGLLL